jgi:hypothetical protein
MTRARVLTAVLAAILLLCAAAIYLDQQGFFGGEATVSTPSTPIIPATPPNPTSGDGYGELK